MNKCHFVFDKTKKSKKFKKNVLKKYKNFSLKKANVIIIAGGDGLMLATIKKYFKYNKPFYGINCGSIGFLMNKYSSKRIDQRINKAKIVNIHPLQITTTSTSKKKNFFLAINELSLLRQSKQTAFLKIKLNNKVLIKKLISDGILVSTPAGSTAYNLSVHGPILSLNSKKLAITPISPFRPRRWKGKIIHESSVIKIKNLNTKKRPISAVADNKEIRNIKRINIKIEKKIFFKLLYDSNNSLAKKIKVEQLRKQTS